MISRRKIQVKVKYVRPLIFESAAEYSTSDSAGVDLRACMDEESVDLAPGERHAFPSGIAIEICEDEVAGFVFSRSGLGAKLGLTVSQGVGVIDPDYRGEIIVSLLNTGKETRTVKRGQRIAQLVFMPICRADLTPVEELSETVRGGGGFGHTGDM
jgi:dUTP pyrophosphatase